MVMSMNVASNAKDVARRMKNFKKKDLPFLTSFAMNATIKDVRKEIVNKTWPKSVHVRKAKFISAALRMKFSTKKKLEASLFDKLNRASLRQHADGGTKTPQGRVLAIPSTFTETKRAASGGISKAWRPASVMKKKGVFITTVKGQPVIMMRRGKKRTLTILYVLEPVAKIKKTFPFYERAEDVTLERFPYHFDKAFRKYANKPRKK